MRPPTVASVIASYAAESAAFAGELTGAAAGVYRQAAAKLQVLANELERKTARERERKRVQRARAALAKCSHDAARDGRCGECGAIEVGPSKWSVDYAAAYGRGVVPAELGGTENTEDEVYFDED